MRGHCSRLLFQPPNRLPSVMYGPHCPPGIQQFFLLDKGKGTRKLSASQRGAARAAGECVPHAAALARLPVKTQEAARREPEQSGASAESAVTTHRGPGAQPRHAFGDFRRETKVTRGAGRSARSGEQEPSLTTCSRGAAPLAYRVRRGCPQGPPPPASKKPLAFCRKI